MNDLETFNEVWNGYIRFNKQRGIETKQRYENILFSIWKHHQDWEEDDGFQIKCCYDGCSEYRTLYRVRKLAEESGLLHKVGNYYVGDHTNYYKKNHILFDLVFRGKENQYGKWLEESKKDIELDTIYKILIDEFNRLNKDNNYSSYNNIPNLDTSLIKKSKLKSLPYDLEKLYILTDELFPHYYDLMMKLNKNVHHHELKFISFILFNKEGLPTGRPYSAFCSTLNPNKTHKDTSGEYRPDFLKRIGLADYYEVYDIKSEIPRINWLFHTGEWKDDDYDFYTEIIKDTEIDKYLDWNMQRGQTKYTEYEDSMKQIFMRIYFGKGSDKQSFSGWLNNKLERLNDDWMEYWIKEENGYELNYDIWQVLCNSTRKICGTPIGNLIFWFAFFIETEVKIELLKRGKRVYNVYDGFYFNEDISNEIKDILKEKAELIYKNYMIKIK